MLALFLACAPLLAGVEIGSPAPDAPVPSWFNGGSESTLRDFRGAVLLLEFFATWDAACVEHVAPLAAFHREYEPRGLRIVALASEPRDAVADWVKARAVPYRVGIDAGGRGGKAFGIRAVPSAFAIGPTGKVLWQGTLSKIDKTDVERWLDLVKVPEVGDVGEALAPAKAAFAKGEYGKAWKAAAAVLGKPEASRFDRADAEKVATAVQAYAEARLAAAGEFEKGREPLAAIEAYERVEAAFEGSELAARAKERADALEKDPAAKQELAAAKALKPIRAADAAAKGDSSKRAVLEQYRAFAKKWRGTKACDDALALADALWESMRGEG